MTPEQTEIILEEYIEMNRVRDPESEATEVSLDDMAVSSAGRTTGQQAQLSPEGEDLARRVKAEMAARLGVSAQIQE